MDYRNINNPVGIYTKTYHNVSAPENIGNGAIDGGNNCCEYGRPVTVNLSLPGGYPYQQSQQSAAFSAPMANPYTYSPYPYPYPPQYPPFGAYGYPYPPNMGYYRPMFYPAPYRMPYYPGMFFPYPYAPGQPPMPPPYGQQPPQAATPLISAKKNTLEEEILVVDEPVEEARPAKKTKRRKRSGFLKFIETVLSLAFFGFVALLFCTVVPVSISTIALGTGMIALAFVLVMLSNTDRSFFFRLLSRIVALGLCAGALYAAGIDSVDKLLEAVKAVPDFFLSLPDKIKNWVD